MKIISERGMCKHMFPMIEARGKKFESEYTVYNKGVPIFIGAPNNRWNLFSYKFMDTLASLIRIRFESMCFNDYNRIPIDINDEIFKKIPLYENPTQIKYLDNNYIPTDNHDEVLMNSIREVYWRIKDNKIKTSDLLKHPSLMEFNATQLHEIVNNIGQCRFKVVYHYLSKNEKDGRDYSKFYSNINGDFDYLLTPILCKGDPSTDGKYYHTEYGFKIDSILGSIFIHNIYCGGYQNILDDFNAINGLSKYTYILYRMFILHTNFVTKLELNKVCNYLGLTKHKQARTKKFESMIEELNESKLIRIISKNIIGDFIEYKVQKNKS